MGGSLRNPASFNNVVGLRPSVGRVPDWPTTNGWELTSVGGPMARSVEDLALLLSVHRRPVASRAAVAGGAGLGRSRLPLARRPGRRTRRAVDSTSAARSRSTTPSPTSSPRRRRCSRPPGAAVEDAHPVLHSADAAFRTLRAWVFQHRFRTLLEKRPDGFKQSLKDNILLGADLTGERRRARPTSSSPRSTTGCARSSRPTTCWRCPSARCRRSAPTRSTRPTINGEQQATYLDWMRSAYLITVTGCPAISVPAGLHPRGLAGRHPARRPGARRAAAARDRARLRAGHPRRRPAPRARGAPHEPTDPDRHRHGRHVHRRRRRRRGHRRARGHQDAVDAGATPRSAS